MKRPEPWRRSLSKKNPSGPCRKTGLLGLGYLLLVLIPGLAIQSNAQESSVSMIFTAPERLAVLAQGPQGQVILNRIETKTKTLSSRELSWPGSIRPVHPILKADQNGRLFIVWEELGGASSRVGFGPITDAGGIRPEEVRLPLGWNSLPDLSFDAANEPWLIWDNSRLDRHALYVQQMQTGKTWVLSSAGVLLAPQVVCDRQGRVWVFWGETSPTRFRILYRVFNGGDWSPPQPACDAGPLAIQSFKAVVDERGVPGIVWSQYGSPGYGIYLRIRQQREGDDQAWAPPVCLATGDGAQNINPDIAFASGLGPVVTWIRLSARESVMCLRVSANGRWNETVVIPGIETRESVPRMAIANGNMAVGWWSQGRPAWQVYPVLQMVAPGAPLGAAPLAPDFSNWWFGRAFPAIINNPALDETAYIGFGDSITYGVINHEWTPELGYVPRLQVILSQNFGPSTVSNRGLGSEITINGLARIPSVLEEELARYILILEGTNDTLTSTYNPDVTGYNLRQMVLLSRNFGAFPALGTLLPRFDPGAQPQRIAEVNDRIRTLSQTMILPLVDFYTLFTDYPAADGGVLSLLSDDLKHPSEKGYQFIADKWFEAIRNFPFPPEYVQISREYDKIFFYQKPGNMIRWQDNMKIYDTSLIRGYRLYRKLRAAEDDAYALIAFVEGEPQYFDTAISAGEQYSYVISTVMTDGVEGACCLPVNF